MKELAQAHVQLAADLGITHQAYSIYSPGMTPCTIVCESEERAIEMYRKSHPNALHVWADEVEA